MVDIQVAKEIKQSYKNNSDICHIYLNYKYGNTAIVENTIH